MSFRGPGKSLSGRLASLEAHLKSEHPVLLEVVPTYRELDKVMQRIGLLGNDESLATRIPWWPLVTVLGTFSSGKSTFINHTLGHDIQSTGNQAVDDKFTVVCFGPEKDHRVLPGTALDADPRFPFYGMSQEVEKVAPGEGKRIDAYLQLKTCSTDVVRGKIIIDSPGFDADDQRRSILRLTNHIIDLSDLVLIFFDARHPEPGAMQDTLEHLVKTTVNRPDAGKFLYILNQIDTTAREDNPEQVVAAWQRAIAQAGLTAGRFYTIYNEQAAVPIEDAALRARFEGKRDKDLADIHGRLREVEVERSYRIINMLDMVATEVEQEAVPKLEEALSTWRRRVMIGDVAILALTLVTLAGLMATGLFAPLWDWITGGLPFTLVAVALGALVLVSLHYWVRDLAAGTVAIKLTETLGQVELNLRQAFLRNTRFYRGLYRESPVGWGAKAKRKINEIREMSARHIQRLNDLYTDPSGARAPAAKEEDAEKSELN